MESPIKILTIEDDTTIRKTTVLHLEDCGYTVFQAENGRVGLELFRQHKPDIVLVDLRMPEVGGLEVLERVKSESPDTPAIVISGIDSIQEALAAIKQGAWDFLVKPIDLGVLEHAIQKAAKQTKLIQENRHYWEHLEDEIHNRTKELQIANEKLQKEIAEHKQVEQERIELEKRLRQYQKMEAIGTLAEGIAHDFNNILFSIMSYGTLAKKQIPNENRADGYLSKILTACTRAQSLTQQILTFSRQNEQRFQTIQLDHVIVETLGLLRASLPATIEILPEFHTKVTTTYADPHQIRQVLINLCTNAAHAMRESGGTLEIVLSDASVDPKTAAIHKIKAGDYLLLQMKDTGTGISPELIERIFDPFFTTKPMGEGTGMGLAIVHGIIKSHGGNISIQSELGQGTTCNIYIPKVRNEKEPPVSPEEFLWSGSEHILLVDDEKIIVEPVQIILEGWGHRVTSTTSSIHALELFTAHPDQFDLVMMDQTMPQITGFQLALKILKIRKDIPIIIMTGYHDPVTQEQLQKVGVQEFVLKPLTEKTLKNIVSRVLNPDSLSYPQE